MKKHSIFSISFVLGVLLLVTACAPASTPTTTPLPAEPEPDLYLNIIWHQHQPFYAVDTATGLVSAPWVRFHATKDYVDMVEILENYPDIHVTFNLTPSLLKQIESFNSGQRDIVWEMTRVPSDELTVDQKTYILQRFFDTNAKIIDKFPRYKELQKMRGGTSQRQIENALASWTGQDFLDLQVLFNLAWTDSSFLGEEPYASLVSKGSGYSEEDKSTLLELHATIMGQVIPVHKQYQDNGQIEITFTPYAHPILPLLIDTNLATVAVPDITLPSLRFMFPNDAVDQLHRGFELYSDLFGQSPRGMWPAEGSVAEEMVAMTSQAGVQWMVTDEGILSNSLDLQFTRDSSGVPTNASSLYQPYSVESEGNTLTVFFRDTALSNKVSFDYSQLPAGEAVSDFMGRVRAIRDELKTETGGPYVLTVILDGENAWEYYENDGKDFLNALYTEISNDPTIETVTSSEYLQLARQPLPTIPELWAGSWDSATFQTWIGEQEENLGWDYLTRTRTDLDKYLTGSLKGTIPDDQMELAYQSMLAAEGSDWFWWYGTDKDSGNDSAFDVSFRETLGQVYDALGQERPEFLRVPIIQPTPLEPDKELKGIFTPILDGVSNSTEWQNAGSFNLESALAKLQYGFDPQHLYLGLSGSFTEDFILYLSVPGASMGNPFSEEKQVLGMYATYRLRYQSSGSPVLEMETWDGTSWQPLESNELAFTLGADILEISIPLSDLAPGLSAADDVLLRIASGGTLLPLEAPACIIVPDLRETTWLFTVTDPTGDDHGPGPYTYPTDGVFKPGVFDLVTFDVGSDGENVVFRVGIAGPVENPWGGANNLSIQLVDIYLDTTPSSGSQIMRDARNAAFPTDSGWEYVLTLAGWNYGIFASDNPQVALATVPMTILTDRTNRTITAKIPMSALPGDPLAWGYGVALLSNDGYGTNGVREVAQTGGQWALGGAPADKNHTRIVDYLWPEGMTPTQEQMLSNYLPSTSESMEWTSAEYPQVLFYYHGPE